MVYRVFVEKKTGLDHEAQTLLKEARELLGIEGLENIRLFNRYDAEGLSGELFDYAVKTVFLRAPAGQHIRSRGTAGCLCVCCGGPARSV